MTKKEIASYANRYNPSAFIAKVKENSRQMGATLTYKAYLLYYMMTDKDTPVGAKAVIAGALAYLVLPLDLIPDFLPVGYADDFAAVLTALKAVRGCISPVVEAKARVKTEAIFGSTISKKAASN